MRDKHAEFDIWLEDHIEKSDRESRIVILEGVYDIDWGENKTMLIKEFREKYPNDYYYYFATYYIPLDKLEFDVDIDEDDFPNFKDDFFI